jgi:hypothetical protein
MDVSHFELIYKKQSPQGAADIVLQGYFLKISNLEKKDLSFRLDFVTSPITNADRSLFQNTAVFVDTPGVDNSIGVFALNGQPNSPSFRLNRLVTIPAQGTALVAVLPSDPFTMPGQVPPAVSFECRGFVRLTLPALIKRGSFFPQPQNAGPVKVMLTPQHRATYIGAGGVINDQTQSSLPVAGGSAIASVDAEQGNIIVFEPPGGLFEFDPERFKDILDQVQLDSSTLAGMLAQAANGTLDLGGFNKALAAAGIGIALEKRKV